MRAWMATALLLVPLIAGCLDTDDPIEGVEPIADPARLEGATVHMDILVPVYLIGFPEATATQLSERLTTMDLRPNSALATKAHFEIHAPDAAWQAAFDAAVTDATHPGNGDLTGFTGQVLNGNALEAYLAENLGAIHEAPDGVNQLVVIDTGLRGHAYNYEGDVGWREPVRTFGERHPLLVWDPYAEVDPWVGFLMAHHVPVVTATADHIGAWVERATAIRALHGPIWAPATAPCHAVTIILAVRGTTVTPEAFGMQTWDETLDIPRLQATFANLTGDPTFVDLSVLHLPQDDPALELATRENSAREITRNYMDLNFDQYHIAHEGCEPYLSLVVYGDLADQRTQSNGNADMTLNGRRISTSLVAENVRVMTETIGYNQVWDESTTFERVGPGANPHEWFNWVVSHETGHLFSLPHPNSGGGYSDTGFASTWNVMGYQMRRIVTEMSAVDANNLQRHQAAYAVIEASINGANEATLNEALQAMGEYRWKDAFHLARDA